MLYYGLEWKSLDTYFQMKEISAPDTPPSGEIRIYAKSQTLCMKNDAGSEVCLPTSGTIPTGAGEIGRLAVWASSTTITGYSSLFWDSTNSHLYIGTNASATPHLGADGLLTLDKDANNAIQAIAAHTATASERASLHLIRTRGTHSSQTVVNNNDVLGAVIFKGHGGTTIHDAASVRAEVDGTPDDNDMPGRLSLFTTPDGSTTLTRALTVFNNQFVLVGSSTTAPALRFEVKGAGATNAIAVERSDGIASFIGFRVTGSATANNDFLALFGGGGSHTGLTADRVTTGLFAIYAGETWTGSAKGSYCTIETTPTGSTARAERFRVGPAGQLGIGGATFGTSGDVFTSGGSSAAPSWTTVWGTYTPTLTNVANLDASTAYQCQFSKAGKVITVSGKVDVDPTLTATLTQLGISLPTASNLGAQEDCAGVAFASNIAAQGAAIRGDAANDRAEMVWVSGDVTNQAMYFIFSYEVI